ncbi:hypothetical protein PUNSTDRAFT_123576 [Punctularia strigosozonata HHB-11173 SS5]|uniref:uncharacterized protein n=1 Tax=Punctularia strigosozonata (strain HHB-11173) TaxID=741275 RepID=UPI0004417DAB|nr:uncharacterized protein PUNSTDRAFT_123576 [Punctularia strigosozonata HHB-11173 SS5]EIN13647.1 hypothetical protein PUNSTDRAFT_123576 [Punctularia strigosozonata HHB-11173 SS5]
MMDVDRGDLSMVKSTSDVLNKAIDIINTAAPAMGLAPLSSREPSKKRRRSESPDTVAGHYCITCQCNMSDDFESPGKRRRCDAKIVTRAHLTVDELRARVSSLSQDLLELQRHRNNMLPACRLPPEILGMIFLYVRDSSSHASGRYEWVRVAQVSHYWRSTALSTRGLWSILDLHQPVAALEMNRRADPVPRYLYSHAELPREPTAQNLAAQLQEELRHDPSCVKGVDGRAWYHVRSMVAYLPELLHCRWTAPPEEVLNWSCPRLTNLELLEATSFDWRSALLQSPANLRHLRVSSVTDTDRPAVSIKGDLAQVVTVLQQHTGLNELVLENVLPSWNRAVEALVPVKVPLPNMTRLEIQDSDIRAANWLLSRLQLPPTCRTSFRIVTRVTDRRGRITPSDVTRSWRTLTATGQRYNVLALRFPGSEGYYAVRTQVFHALDQPEPNVEFWWPWLDNNTINGTFLSMQSDLAATEPSTLLLEFGEFSKHTAGLVAALGKMSRVDTIRIKSHGSRLRNAATFLSSIRGMQPLAPNLHTLVLEGTYSYDTDGNMTLRQRIDVEAMAFAASLLRRVEEGSLRKLQLRTHWEKMDLWVRALRRALPGIEIEQAYNADEQWVRNMEY